MAKVFILSGFPGSGKSTHAKYLAQRYGGLVVSADDYFMRHDGTYRFNLDGLPYAHAECFEKFQKALGEKRTVIVDNTNLSAWQISPYVLAANAAGLGLRHEVNYPGGHDVQIVRLACDPVVAFKRQTHGVPEQGFKRMVEDYLKSDVLPWWSVYELTTDKTEPSRRWVRPLVERSLGKDGFESMRWSSDGCWIAHKHGMTIGIEPDGYIHS